MPFMDRGNLPLCDRCKNYFGVKRLYNIRPYNPNGEKVIKIFDGIPKEVIQQEPVLLCKNCRERVWDWITGNTRKLDLSPDRFYGTTLDNYEGFKSE